jgi:predicted ribosomally synthesized peptide with nif11-like leader
LATISLVETTAGSRADSSRNSPPEEEQMHRTELERFLEALQKDATLREQAGSLAKAEDVLHWAKGKGYDLTRPDAEALLKSRGELSDDELDKVAGGDTSWTGGTPPPPTGP